MKTIFKTLAIALTVLFLAGPAVSLADDDDKIDKATVDKIMAMLKDMKCEMDASDIEKEDDGYELDDVACEGGKQFDIKLDENLKETGRKAE